MGTDHQGFLISRIWLSILRYWAFSSNSKLQCIYFQECNCYLPNNASNLLKSKRSGTSQAIQLRRVNHDPYVQLLSSSNDVNCTKRSRSLPMRLLFFLSFICCSQTLKIMAGKLAIFSLEKCSNQSSIASCQWTGSIHRVTLKICFRKAC